MYNAYQYLTQLFGGGGGGGGGVGGGGGSRSSNSSSGSRIQMFPTYKIIL